MLSLDPFLCCKITSIPRTPAQGVLTRGLVLLRAAGLRSSSGTKEKEGSLNPEVRITDVCWSRSFRDSIRARADLRAQVSASKRAFWRKFVSIANKQTTR